MIGPWGSSGRTTAPNCSAGPRAVSRVLDRAYRHGVLQADDLLHHLPAAWLLDLPHSWDDLAFTAAWRRAIAALLERELGTDADAWLRLAAKEPLCPSQREPSSRLCTQGARS
ncbi:hypothetical protein ACWGI0_23375 [Streptomyces sp. NPDC054802]